MEGDTRKVLDEFYSQMLAIEDDESNLYQCLWTWWCTLTGQQTSQRMKSFGMESDRFNYAE